MRKTKGVAGVLGVWLVFNMLAIPFWWGGVGADAGPRYWIQGAMLVGFGLILVFDLASGVFLFSRSCLYRGDQQGDLGGSPCQDGWLLVLAVAAVMGLAGAKVMVDEIARETPLDWSSEGEWAILYICLALQLAYLLALILLPERRVGAG